MGWAFPSSAGVPPASRSTSGAEQESPAFKKMKEERPVESTALGTLTVEHADPLIGRARPVAGQAVVWILAFLALFFLRAFARSTVHANVLTRALTLGTAAPAFGGCRTDRPQVYILA